MGSSQGSTLSPNVAGLVDGSTKREISYVDSLPIYVKELIAGGAAGAFAKTAVAPLERIKILLQVNNSISLHLLMQHFTNISFVVRSFLFRILLMY